MIYLRYHELLVCGYVEKHGLGDGDVVPRYGCQTYDGVARFQLFVGLHQCCVAYGFAWF